LVKDRAYIVLALLYEDGVNLIEKRDDGSYIAPFAYFASSTVNAPIYNRTYANDLDSNSWLGIISERMGFDLGRWVGDTLITADVDKAVKIEAVKANVAITLKVTNAADGVFSIDGPGFPYGLTIKSIASPYFEDTIEFPVGLYYDKYPPRFRTRRDYPIEIYFKSSEEGSSNMLLLKTSEQYIYPNTNYIFSFELKLDEVNGGFEIEKSKEPLKDVDATW
jgi:hypothetical protein